MWTVAGMSRSSIRGNRPGRGGGRQATHELAGNAAEPDDDSEGWIDRLVRDVIWGGAITAGVSFVFIVVYVVSQTLWGSYFGANAGFGLSLSLGVMVLGIGIATITWVLRELGTAAADLVNTPADE